MKKFSLFIVVLFALSLNSSAQMDKMKSKTTVVPAPSVPGTTTVVPTVRTSTGQPGTVMLSSMPGTFRSYGSDVLQGTYRVTFSDDKTVSGTGTIKPGKNGQKLKLSTPWGEKKEIQPGDTKKVVFSTGKENYEFVTFDKKYWLASVGGKLSQIYIPVRMNDIVVIKEGDNFRQLSDDEILKIVEGHKYAEKFVKKKEYDRAFAEYNGIATSPYRSGKAGGEEK